MLIGIHAITEALTAGEKSIAKIWLKRNMKTAGLTQLLSLARQHDVPCRQVPMHKLNRLTNTNHQGAIALLSPIDFMPLGPIIQDAYEKGKSPCVVVLDHIQDMRNFGAIARTAHATAVSAIVIHTEASLPITADAMKTSVGTLLHLPICRTRNLVATLATLQHSGLQVIACSEKGNPTIYEVDFTLPTALLFGGEHKGIAAQHLAKCNAHVRIPMLTHTNSLNVSVATAVALYEWVRQSLL